MSRTPLGRALSAWGELLLPTRCTGCGGVGAGSGPAPVCPACRTRLGPLPGPTCGRCQHPEAPAGAPCPLCETWPSTVVAARSATRFGGVAAQLVHQLKYEGWVRIAPVMAEAMARTVRTLSARPDVAVPIPTTPGRLRDRGFNAAGLLADEVARILGIPVRRALSRPSEGPRQVGLSPSRRAANVRNAFVAEPAEAVGVHSHHVLLVDDVLTTGSTGAAAAEALQSSGVESVTLVTFARALPDLPGA